MISRLKKGFSQLASRRWALVAIVVLGLAAAGAILSFVIAPVREGLRARQPALRLDAAGAGPGATLAILGGFRALVADFAWIRMYTIWERRDLPGTQTLLRLVTTIDPRPVYFWLNAARITAYDFPFWRVLAAGGFEAVPDDVQRRLSHEQARSALRGLETAMRFHPGSVELWVERANIELNKLGDLNAAAESYRRAWELPGAPYYVPRLRAEVLRRAGRRAEALEWLTRLHPTLPPADEGAAADVVLGRIRDLERELGVPKERSYRPPGARE
ncbi:MAG: tetratricopeptide repeat protein [Opitutaceae bacterium]